MRRPSSGFPKPRVVGSTPAGATNLFAEIVHDLDLEDGRYGRPETTGMGRMIVGIALATADDEARIARGATVFDGLYESFRKQAR